MTAIEMCINRFDEDTKQSFKDLYTKVDSGVEEQTETETETSEEVTDNVPF